MASVDSDNSAWAVGDKVTEVIDGTQTIINQSRRKHLTLVHLDKSEPVVMQVMNKMPMAQTDWCVCRFPVPSVPLHKPVTTVVST